MKIIKFLLFLIILGLIGLLAYQNIDYFIITTPFTLDLKFNQWQWTAPTLPNWAFWGICFGLGLLITGIRGLRTAYGLDREIKKREAEIAELTARNKDLQTRLDVFIHDPYIQKGLSDKTDEEPAAIEADTQESGDVTVSEPEADESAPTDNSDIRTRGQNLSKE